MQRTNTVVVGAGQCGLAMSRELSRRSIDHLVLERGRIGNSWRNERWDSLRLLTPNWLNGLFGHMPGMRPQKARLRSTALVRRPDRSFRRTPSAE
jgi:putative flavoprotein involved in K+ transport